MSLEGATGAWRVDEEPAETLPGAAKVPTAAEVEELRQDADEAAGDANVDPGRVTAAEHHRVDELQAAAGKAAVAYNASRV